MTQSFEHQMLHFMSENKRILNLHEKNFSDLENFQANTTVFQTNTNALLEESGDTDKATSSSCAERA